MIDLFPLQVWLLLWAESELFSRNPTPGTRGLCQGTILSLGLGFRLEQDALRP